MVVVVVSGTFVVVTVVVVAVVVDVVSGSQYNGPDSNSESARTGSLPYARKSMHLFFSR